MNNYELLVNHQNYALLGMSDDPSRYAYKIYQELKKHNKTVYGVNPKYDTILGDRVYADLEAIGQPIDIVVFVVNPKIGIHMLDAVKALNIKTVWLQPGSSDAELVAKAQSLGLTVVEDCVLAQYALNNT